MIIAILAGTPESVRANLRALDLRRATLPAEVAAEIRLDLMDPPDTGVFANAPVPLVATCRRPRDGGRFRGGEAERLELLARAARAGARWIDVEADTLGAWKPVPPSGVIASLHDFEATPPDLPASVLRLLLTGAAFVKLATRTRSLLDLMTLAAAARQAPGRVIAVGLGSASAASRVLADRVGSAALYARFSSRGAQPPHELVDAGVPDLDDLVDFHRGGLLDRTTPAFAVLGDRADESIGPLVFNRIFRDRRIPATYVHLKTPSLAGLRETCRLLNIRGLSVTTPFKESVLAAADALHPSAQSIGAANTLVTTEEGWTARNTDRLGVSVPVAAALRAGGREPRGLGALVVGAGGMGRAAAAGLAAIGCRVAIASRGADRLRQAAELLGVEMVADPGAGGRRWDVVVNATPAGSSRDPEGRAVDLAWMAKGGVLVETNYRPLMTLLSREGHERGLEVVGGDAVYAAQAAAQLALFLPSTGDLGDEVRSKTSWALESTASS